MSKFREIFTMHSVHSGRRQLPTLAGRALVVGAALFAVTVFGVSAGGAGSNTGSKAATAAAAETDSVAPGRIAFRRYLNDAETIGAIFTIAADGSGTRQISNPPAATVDDEPDWSPDGSRLLFTRYGAGGSDVESHRLFVVSSEGTGLTPLSPDVSAHGDFIVGFDGQGAFSPDGKRIAFSYAHGKVGPGAAGSDQIKFSDIWLMNADGSQRRQVTHSSAYAGDAGGVAWSPDGKRLVYARSNLLASSPAGGRGLFTVNVDGSHERRLTPVRLGANGTPDWSPATNRIVFRAVVNEESGVGNFFTVKPDGTSLTQITHFAGITISHKVGFSPDGKRIVFAKAAHGKNGIFTAALRGSALQRITNTPRADSSPDWGRSR